MTKRSREGSENGHGVQGRLGPMQVPTMTATAEAGGQDDLPCVSLSASFTNSQ